MPVVTQGERVLLPSVILRARAAFALSTAVRVAVKKSSRLTLAARGRLEIVVSIIYSFFNEVEGKGANRRWSGWSTATGPSIKPIRIAGLPAVRFINSFNLTKSKEFIIVCSECWTARRVLWMTLLASGKPPNIEQYRPSRGRLSCVLLPIIYVF
jgi:hypothetical protein